MKEIVIGAAAILAAATFAAPAQAGCIKGAIVGGIAGHMVGHGGMGAAAGCAIGHHRAVKRQNEVTSTGSVGPNTGYGNQGRRY